MKKFIILLANSQRYFIHALRVAVFITFLIVAAKNLFLHRGDYFSYISLGLATVLATATLLGIWFHKIGLIGGLLVVVVSLLIVVLISVNMLRETGTAQLLYHDLFRLGRMIILMATGLVFASDSAKQIFREYVLRMGKG